MHTEGAGWSGISQIEVEVENILFLDIQFAGYYIHQEVSLLQFIIDDAKDRENILLLAQLHTIIHLTVEVDGKIADLQQWALGYEEGVSEDSWRSRPLRSLYPLKSKGGRTRLT